MKIPYYISRFSVLLILFSFSFSLKAQKLAGGEIYYRFLGNKTYLITAHVYRKCDQPSLNNLNGYVISDTFKIPMNFARISISKINDTCGNPCNIQNVKSNPGYEKHTYTDTVSFTAAPYNVIVNNNLCQVRFAIHQYLRDFTTTTHSGGNGMFYLDAMVNLCFKLNDLRSPEFSFEPKFNYQYLQPVNYSPAPLAFNKEDSLVFDLAPALHDENTPVNYTGYSFIIPMSPYCPPNPTTVNCTAIPSANPPRGFYFDKNRCEIIFTPNRNKERGTIKFKVSLYRKDSLNRFVLVAYTCREMSARVDSTGNKLPTLKGVASFSICQNSRLCMYQSAGDTDTSDVVSVEWNYGIPGAFTQFTDPNSREKEMQFCWTPDAASARRNFVAFKAYDKACNVNMVSRNHLILKKKLPPSKRINAKIDCHAYRFETIPSDSQYYSPNGFTYAYRVFSTDSPGITLFSTNRRIDTFFASKAGTYGIELTFNYPAENCPQKYIDTVSLIPSKFKLKGMSDSIICVNDSISLGPFSGIGPGYKLQWEYPFGSKAAGDTFSAVRLKLKTFAMPVVVHVSESGSCRLSDTLMLYSGAGFEFNVKSSDTTFCKNILSEIHARNIIRHGVLAFTWFVNGVNQNVNDTFISRVYNANSQLVLKISDTRGCVYSDTMDIKSVGKPLINLKDTSVCHGAYLRLNPNSLPYPFALDYKWHRNDTLLNISDSFLDIKVDRSMSVRLRLENEIGCHAEKTVAITALPLPLFQIVSDTFFNRYNRINMSTDKPFAKYRWSTGAQTRNNLFWAYELGAAGAYTITCTVTDINACTFTDSIRIFTDKFSTVSSQKEPELVIYPQPFENQLYIYAVEQGLLNIYSTDGRLMTGQNIHAGLNLIPAEMLQPGIYLLQFGTYTQLIVKL